ncbi:hypothetical protein KKH13_05170 [Patescibacteria group bacterium]|nr:hypothetical protein [Patescibacteria group bacterium]
MKIEKISIWKDPEGHYFMGGDGNNYQTERKVNEIINILNELSDIVQSPKIISVTEDAKKPSQKWCKHIIIRTYGEGTREYIYKDDVSRRDVVVDYLNWRFCPICGRSRPI